MAVVLSKTVLARISFEAFPFEGFPFEDFPFEDLASTQRRLAVNQVHRGAASAKDYQPVM